MGREVKGAVARLPVTGIALRVGRRIISSHIHCAGCQYDLYGLHAEWFRQDEADASCLRWTVLCPQCGLRQDAPGPPNMALVNSILTSRRGSRSSVGMWAQMAGLATPHVPGSSPLVNCTDTEA